MDLSIGQIVYSKSGRDKKRVFIVLKVEGDYLYLSDGKLRLVDKPKKKKAIHVQPTNEVSKVVSDIIIAGKLLKNSDVKQALKNVSEAR